MVQLSLWNPTDPLKRKSNIFIIDLAVPVQSIDPLFVPLNSFLSQSLTQISTYLMQFYTNRQIPPGTVDYDGNYLTRILKKILQNNSELNVFPLFFINSQEEYKDESKQILTFTQQ